MCSSGCIIPSELLAPDKNEIRNVVVQLESSDRRFHSHHWFHIAEHYLAHPSRRNLTSAQVLYMIPPSASFYSQLTRTSVFFLLLSLPFENIHRAVVVDSSRHVQSCPPSSVHLQSYQSPLQYFSLAQSTFLEAYVNTSRSLASIPQVDTQCVYFHPTTNLLSSDMRDSSNFYIASGKHAYPSSDWFPDANDATLIRRRILRFCDSSSGSGTYIGTSSIFDSDQPLLKLVIYQRDRNRRLLDVDGFIARILGEASPRWRVMVLRHEDDGDPCALHRALRDAHMLLTPHGFQSLSELFTYLVILYLTLLLAP